MSTYSNLSIELIGTGEQSGTWGTTTNTNLGTALEEAIVGTTDLVVTTGTNTPAWSTSSNASQIPRHLRINLTGSAGGTGDLVVPTLSGGKNYIIKNSSNTTITVKTASGTGIAVPIGTSMSLYQDGTNVVVTDSHHTGAGVFTTLSASGAVTGAGFTARFATPGPIGNTSPSTGNFTTLGTTGNVTLGNAVGDQVIFNAGTATVPNNLIFSGTGTITTPSGTTAQRPGSPAEGMLRYNSQLDEFEGYAASAWGSIGGGASAGGAVYENKQSITANYTMTTGTNGHSVGPITVDSGVAVTIPSGSSWLVDA
tara:strand:- start:89 stop:1021 length:933 start_codon:yes stop_codon:yes gene_type:complete